MYKRPELCVTHIRQATQTQAALVPRLPCFHSTSYTLVSGTDTVRHRTAACRWCSFSPSVGPTKFTGSLFCIISHASSRLYSSSWACLTFTLVVSSTGLVSHLFFFFFCLLEWCFFQTEIITSVLQIFREKSEFARILYTPKSTQF